LVLSKPGLPLYLRFARLGGWWWWVLKVSEFWGYLSGPKYDIIYGVAEGLIIPEAASRERAFLERANTKYT
jgi:hypothetical protein